MRACLLREYFHPDTTGPQVWSEITRALADNFGVEFDVITSSNSYADCAACFPAYSEWDGIRIHRVRTPRTKQPTTLKRLLAGIRFSLAALGKLLSRRRRYDLLIVLSCPPALPFVADLYRWLTGTPYVYLVPDLFPDLGVNLGELPASSPLVRLARRLQRRWLKHASRVIVLGRCMKDYLVRTYGLPPEQVAVITSFADPQVISPQDKQTQFRREHGLTGFVVLYAGNFGPYHRFEDILDAAAALRDSHPEITFALVGGGARFDEVRERAATRNLSNVRVIPAVPREQLSDLLASADLSLVTLEPGAEGLGVPSKFYSILASGRPTLAVLAEGSEVARVCAEAQCGVQCDLGDAGRLANLIVELASDPERLAAMGHNAVSALQDRYTLEHVARRYHEVFRQSMAGPATQEATTCDPT